jgi:F-type H+-transporting ATPase subunit alpha
MNAGISVSRVGGAAQVKSMRKASGTLKLELAQYREVEAFAQFGSDLDQATREQLANGERLTMILRQGQYAPMPVEEQVVQLYAATPQETRTSWVRRIPAADVPRYASELVSFMRSKQPQVLDDLRTSGELSDEIAEKLNTALDEFGKVFEPSGSVD